MAAKKPAAKKPAAKKPAVKKPAVKKPAKKKPAVKKPAAKKPAVKKPAVTKPAVKKPAAKKPAVKKPAVKKPAAKKPVALKPTERKPLKNAAKSAKLIPGALPDAPAGAAAKTAKATKPAKASKIVGKKANSAFLAEPYVAPALAGRTSDGTAVAKALYAGKWVVVYFYPRDMTPGCTLESRDFQAFARAFDKEGAVVLGVSKDSCESHRKFVDKEGLHDFHLVSDEGGSLCEAFGVWTEKSNYGKKYMGIERTTFLIDPQGHVRAKWERVKVAGHAEAVLEVLRELKRS